MKKILFITIASGVAASTRVRVTNLIPELERHGFATKTVRYPKTFRGKWSLLKCCVQFDVVFLQKRTPPLFFALLLKIFAKKLVYDFDDAIYYTPNAPDETRDPDRLRRFINIVRKADLVIAGNKILAKEAQNYTTNCTVLPSAVETRNIPVKDYGNRHEKFVIGWVGGEINLPCLEQLIPVFQELAKRHAIQLRVISSKSIESPEFETLFIPWDENTQELEIARFDVGVMPLFNYPHTQGKCAYKALQYMAAGVPAVVSNVGINTQVVEHGVSGYVVDDLNDFAFYLEALIMDRSLIRSMGEKAKIRVKDQFSIEYVGRFLADMLVTCLERV